MTDPELKIAADFQTGVPLTVRCEGVLRVISTSIPSSLFLVYSLFQQMVAEYFISYIPITAFTELLLCYFHQI